MNDFNCPKDEIQIVLLMAFRYAVGRHFTQCLYSGNYPLAQIIIDNFENTENWTLKQMLEDIEWEQRSERIYRERLERDTKEPWYRLKAHCEDYYRMLTDCDDNELSKSTLAIKAGLKNILKQIDTTEFPAKYKHYISIEDTSYLNPLKESIKIELKRRKA